jgi:N-acetylglucosaminyldiphosphoundecaprenol N-acetyl-beta-D-mannosaminyltransferase
VFASKDPAYKSVLNQADLSLADGVGILWAARYLDLPARNRISALLQIFTTGAAIIFDRKSMSKIIKEQISGSRLLFDLAALASAKGYSLALAGGLDSVAAQTSYELKKKFPQLKINLAVSGGVPFDDKLADEISRSNSDILLIAYQPPKQEKWIAENIARLNVKLAMGVGGTFDYVSGKRKPAPEIFYKLGLEWFWRLITQPWRIKRMWNAIVVFISIIYKSKVSKIKHV